MISFLMSLLPILSFVNGFLALMISVRLSLMYDNFRRDGLLHLIFFFAFTSVFWIGNSFVLSFIEKASNITPTIIIGSFLVSMFILNRMVSIYDLRFKSNYKLFIITFCFCSLYLLDLVTFELPYLFPNNDSSLLFGTVLVLSIIVIVNINDIYDVFVSVANQVDVKDNDKYELWLLAKGFAVLALSYILTFWSQNEMQSSFAIIVSTLGLILILKGITGLVEFGKIDIE